MALIRNQYLTALLVAILLAAGIAIFFQFRPGVLGRTQSGIPVTGVFICEKTAYTWQGTEYLVHKYDPYVYCEKTNARTARKAIQCPSCRAWVLPLLGPVSTPFAEMTREEYDEWEQQNLDLLSTAKCPQCGAPLAPTQEGEEPGRYVRGKQPVIPSREEGLREPAMRREVGREASPGAIRKRVPGSPAAVENAEARKSRSGPAIISRAARAERWFSTHPYYIPPGGAVTTPIERRLRRRLVPPASTTITPLTTP